MPSKPRIKLLFSLFLPIYLLSPFFLQAFRSFVENPFANFFQSEPIYYPPYLMICNKTNSSMNYLGPSLVVSNSHQESDLVLCPGDTFGDLNETYITVKSCNLAMYHQGQIIWSSKNYGWHPTLQTETHYICAVSLQKDGNLVLFEEDASLGPKQMWRVGESETNFNPFKTELRVWGQRIQIVQTFEDGAQRLFYADADHQDFIEDLGEPKKIADKFIVKNHQDEDRTIFRRNEYIGDLNGTHLLLQTNCVLQLRNKNKTIWAFAPGFNQKMDCSFNIQGGDEVGSQIGISQRNDNNNRYPYLEKQSIIPYQDVGRSLQSQIMLEEDRLIIIQTLEDGTERRFYSEPSQSQRQRLPLKKGPRQIAHNNITIPPSNSLEGSIIIEEMDYIGNLSGLHLILQEDCTFMLANGSQTLLEWSTSLTGCAIKIDLHGPINFMKTELGRYRLVFSLPGGLYYRNFSGATGVQLALGNNLVALTLERKDRAPEIYHAGQYTDEAFFYFISGHSIRVKANDKEDRVFTVMSYMGDLNGAYAVLGWDCNWILKNKTQVIWQSGVFPERHIDCVMTLKRDGSVEIASEASSLRKNVVWSTRNLTVNNEKQVESTELLVNNDGLWLMNSYTDGTMKKFKAEEDTNSFAPVSSEHHEFSLSSIDL